MSDFSPEIIARSRKVLVDELKIITDQLKQARLAAERARMAATAAKSHAFLRQEGPMEMRKHKSIIDPEYQTAEDAALVAEEVVKSLDSDYWLVKERLLNSRKSTDDIREEAYAIGLTQRT